jgi:hypothetical protein
VAYGSRLETHVPVLELWTDFLLVTVSFNAVSFELWTASRHLRLCVVNCGPCRA